MKLNMMQKELQILIPLGEEQPPEVNPSPHQRDVYVKCERILSAADIVQSKLKN